ncbi:16S rRNA (adenine(1518)-N(6)/adenine(1519)-N(6))-dimethyltransferase RsmA [Lapidilactobacillus luobeiensis]|uniref:16S rRNA (adenine(1518)-N(6)/adenine(1519)-N(6))- dimethyltransferase RsmA n=1 Tax=Lapidilactobacillus luobeiensis TaxID=2950371 RepID=UPI0021C3A65E|nr:16S rRNA (adenine(1518)-N(6)/adenine(1519)-N(6))-dimethyltransferase RsmA [Lapidilactobacillus luobeiensis]
MSEQPQRLDIADPIRTNAILHQFHFEFKKSLGQNFLTNRRVIAGILAAADLQPTDLVIEIGPGIGSLTEQLARRVQQVIAVEIDQRLIPILGETLAPYSNVQVVHQDILVTDLTALLTEYAAPGYGQVKVVANLPYYITTPIMFSLIAGQTQPDVLVLMMQKEVAQRIIAQPGHKDFGPLSISTQLQMQAEIDQIVPKTAFVPQPNVDSAVLRLRRYPHSPYQITDQQRFDRIVQASFQQRRKNLQNNLLRLVGKDQKNELLAAFKQVGLMGTLRAEQLTIPDFIELTAALSGLRLVK